MSERRLLLAIVALAFALRLGAALVWQPVSTGDAADYERLTRGLVAGEGYVNDRGQPTAWRPPGYPAFLALVEVVAGEGRTPRVVAQAAVGAGVVAVTWFCASGLGAGVGLVAAALVALDAVQIALAGRTLSEGLFTLLSLGVVALSLGNPSRARAGLAGVVAGLAVLTRGLFVAYPVVLAGLLVLRSRREGPEARRASWAAALILLVAFGGVLAPWAARNARVLGEPVPVATQGGFTLYASWFPSGPRAMGTLPEDSVTAGAVALSEVEQNAYFTERTVAGLLADPLRVPRLIALKLAYFWVPLDWEILPWSGVVNPTYLFVLIWAGVGCAWARGRLRGEVALWCPLVYAVGMAIAFYGSPRMRAPVEPLLAIVAAVGLVEWARRHGRRSAVLAVGGSLAGVLALAVMAEPLKDLALALLTGIGVWRS